MITKAYILLAFCLSFHCLSAFGQEASSGKWGTIRIRKQVASFSGETLMEKEPLNLNKEELNLFEMPLQISGPKFGRLYSPTATPKEGNFVLYDFVIDRKGEVKQIRILESKSAKQENKIKKMLGMTKWRPAVKDSVSRDCRFPVQILYFD